VQKAAQVSFYPYLLNIKANHLNKKKSLKNYRKIRNHINKFISILLFLSDLSLAKVLDLLTRQKNIAQENNNKQTMNHKTVVSLQSELITIFSPPQGK
jgi:hypothetical protein